MTAKKYYWCDKLDERISGTKQKINCSYARCSGSCLMGRVADVCNVASAIERGDSPSPSYQEWLRSTREAAEAAGKNLRRLHRDIVRITKENDIFLRQYERERKQAGLA